MWGHIYIKYLYYKKSIQCNINTWRQVQVWYHGEHQLENAYSPFCCVWPLLYYQYLWVGESGKSPWYLRGWRLWILQNFEFPHPFPSNSKQCREFSPAQGQRSQFIPLYSPTYSPGWPGVLLQGQADDMCITNHLEHFLNFWTLWVGACLRLALFWNWGLLKYSPFSQSSKFILQGNNK